MRNDTMKKLLAFILIAFSFAIILSSCEKVTEKPTNYTAADLIKRHQAGLPVEDADVTRVRQELFDRLFFDEAHGSLLKESGIDSSAQIIFLLVQENRPGYGKWIYPRMKVFTGNPNPPVYSISCIVEGGFVTPSGFIDIALGGVYINFPPGSTVFNVVNNKIYFVFYSLTPIYLSYSDGILYRSTWYNYGQGAWITVDRSQDWYFAISQDGINNYSTIIVPDTIIIN